MAFVADQDKVELAPLETLVGLAERVIVGAAATDTVTDCVAEPPLPVQVRVYLVVEVMAELACDPLGASLPLQPPEALQEVALLADQESVEVAPLETVVGLALRVTVGAGAFTETVAD